MTTSEPIDPLFGAISSSASSEIQPGAPQTHGHSQDAAISADNPPRLARTSSAHIPRPTATHSAQDLVSSATGRACPQPTSAETAAHWSTDARQANSDKQSESHFSASSALKSDDNSDEKRLSRALIRSPYSPEAGALVGAAVGTSIGAAAGGYLGQRLLGPSAGLFSSYVGGSIGGLVGSSIGYTTGHVQGLAELIGRGHDVTPIREVISSGNTLWSEANINREFADSGAFESIWFQHDTNRDIPGWLDGKNISGHQNLTSGVQDYVLWALDTHEPNIRPINQWLGNKAWVENTLNQYDNTVLAGNLAGVGLKPELWAMAPPAALLELHGTRSGTNGIMQAALLRSQWEEASRLSPAENSVRSYFAKEGRTTEFLSRFSCDQLNGDPQWKAIKIPEQIADMMSVAEMLRLNGARSETDFVKDHIHRVLVNNARSGEDYLPSTLEIAEHLWHIASHRRTASIDNINKFFDNYVDNDAVALEGLAKAMQALQNPPHNKPWSSLPSDLRGASEAGAASINGALALSPSSVTIDIDSSISSAAAESEASDVKTQVKHASTRKTYGGIEFKYKLGAFETGATVRAGPAHHATDSNDPSSQWIYQLKLTPAAFNPKTLSYALPEPISSLVKELPSVEAQIELGLEVNFALGESGFLPAFSVTSWYIYPKIELKAETELGSGKAPLADQIAVSSPWGSLAAGLAVTYADWRSNKDFSSAVRTGMQQGQLSAVTQLAALAGASNFSVFANDTLQADGAKATNTVLVNIAGQYTNPLLIGGTYRPNPPKDEAHAIGLGGFTVASEQKATVPLIDTEHFELNGIVLTQVGAAVHQRKRTTKTETPQKSDDEIAQALQRFQKMSDQLAQLAGDSLLSEARSIPMREPSMPHLPPHPVLGMENPAYEPHPHNTDPMPSSHSAPAQAGAGSNQTMSGNSYETYHSDQRSSFMEPPAAGASSSHAVGQDGDRPSTSPAIETRHQSTLEAVLERTTPADSASENEADSVSIRIDPEAPRTSKGLSGRDVTKDWSSSVSGERESRSFEGGSGRHIWENE